MEAAPCRVHIIYICMLVSCARCALHVPPAVRSSRVSMGLFDSIREAWEDVEVTSGRKSAVASHILMRDRIQALLLKESIDEGRIAFSDAARQYSSCPSAGKGGSLGRFGPGDMAPAFDALVFDPDTAVGEVNVCSTSFGTHLVTVLERTGVEQTSQAELAEKASAAEAAKAAAAAASLDPLRVAAQAAAEAAAAAAAASSPPRSSASPAPVGSAIGSSVRSPRERLSELNDLLASEMISQAEFDAKRRAIIDAL